MTPLVRKALASTPLTAAEVEGIYAIYPPPLPDSGRIVSAVRRLCESHERLRAELDGATALLDDRDRYRAALEQIARAWEGGDLGDNNYRRQQIARDALGWVGSTPPTDATKAGAP